MAKGSACTEVGSQQGPVKVGAAGCRRVWRRCQSGDSWAPSPIHLGCSKTLTVSACGGPRMSQKFCHSSQSLSFPFPPQDQSKPPLPRSPLFISSISWRPTFSSPLLPALPTNPCAAPAVLQGKDADLPAQKVARGQPTAPHAGGNLARPELLGRTPSVATESPRACRHWGPCVLPVPISRVGSLSRKRQPQAKCALFSPF